MSYIKPHWPWLAPAPYQALYTPDHVLAAVRAEAERKDPHPVYGAFLAQEYSRNFARDEVREWVVPTYMGLVRQIDDHLGRLLGYLEERALHDRFRPRRFNMENDPDEFVDLGADPGYAHVRRELHERLFTWFRRRNRTETEESFLFGMGSERDERLGIIIGRWQPSGRSAMPIMISFSL